MPASPGFVLGPPGFMARFGMNITAGLAVAANPVRLHQVTWLYTLAFIPAIGGLYLYLPAPTGLGLLNMWVAMPLIIIATLLILKLAAFGPMKENISKQFAIFKNRHTWSMTALYLVTFGSLSGFHGFAAIDHVIYGDTHILDAASNTWSIRKNPKCAVCADHAWIVPIVGGADPSCWVRLISDKLGGSIVTPAHLAVWSRHRLTSATSLCSNPFRHRRVFFTQFLITSSCCSRPPTRNGSTFRTVGVIFDRVQAARCSVDIGGRRLRTFIAPVVIVERSRRQPENAMY